MQRLRLDNNVLGQLPELLGKLQSLEVLTFSNNCVERFPLGMKGLRSKLAILHCSSNLIKEIPEEIACLSRLKSLLTENNRIAYLPNKMYLLSHIQEISLEWFIYVSPSLPLRLSHNHQ